MATDTSGEGFVGGKDGCNMKGESEFPTPWAIRCSGNKLGLAPCNDGNLIFLTAEQYMEQLALTTELWECPRCMQVAEFDHENYLKATGMYVHV